ncbi:hypothetical protein ABID26_004058 [Mesorhizobium shonense]|uniref:Uncharacterized protein n=1 Tax=Mesorhizobium shonense TaxID=1209948 RepID=A0ABV2HVK4_9HYPH
MSIEDAGRGRLRRMDWLEVTVTLAIAFALRRRGS